MTYRETEILSPNHVLVLECRVAQLEKQVAELKEELKKEIAAATEHTDYAMKNAMEAMDRKGSYGIQLKEHFFTIGDIAAMCKISRKAVLEAVRAGKLKPPRDFGNGSAGDREKRFWVRDVLEWLELLKREQQ
jgi:hypothetical protein